MSEKIIAIDLGTGNSAVAVFEGNKPTMIPAKDTGSYTTPSIVAFTKNGDVLVGTAAARQRVTNPKNTIYAIKRFMGKTFEEALRTREFEPDGPNYTPRISALMEVKDGSFSYQMSILKSSNGNPVAA